MSDSTPTEQSQGLSDNEAENLALAAAEAIKRLVRELSLIHI